MDEQEKNPQQPTEEAKPEIDERQIAQAIQQLLDEGLSAEQVMQVVEAAVSDGALPEAALKIAGQLLQADDEEAQSLFGLE